MASDSDNAHQAHGGNGAHSSGMEWLNTHLGGLIMPFGKKAEAVLDRSMFFIVNNFFLRIGKIYVFVLAPLIFIELFVHFTGI